MSDAYVDLGYADAEYMDGDVSSVEITTSYSEVTLSIYYIDHTNTKIKLDNKIVSLEDGVLEIDNLKLYNSLTFVANDLYINPIVISDLVERIEVKYQLDDNEPISEFFVIDSVDYLLDNNIKVFCKSKTIKYSYKYSGNLNELVQATSLKDLLDTLLSDVTIAYYDLTDIVFYFDYSIENKSIEEVITELQKITLFDYYFYRGVLYFEDKKSINSDDVSVQKFTALNDIIEFNTTTNKDEKKINKILINDTEDEVVFAEPTITLDLRDSPQCCSPDSVITFEDDGNTYKINPVNAYYIVYFSPTIKLPEINMQCESGDRVVIETYQLENDSYVSLVGGIDELIAIEGVENYSFELGYNLIAFDYVEAGELKVTYKTKVLHGTISHSKFPKNLDITIKHFDQILKHKHEIELNGYFPIPYTKTVNLVSDWGIDYADAIDGDVSVSKLNEGAFDSYGDELSVSLFAEFEIILIEYGTYKFDREGQEPLFMDWYINSHKFYMNEVV